MRERDEILDRIVGSFLYMVTLMASEALPAITSV